MSSGIQNRVGNYLHADGAVRRRIVDGTHYIVGIAGAYDAFGLIGPEHNGVFVLNDTDKTVVLDRHAPETSGYGGPSKAQWDALRDVMQMDAPTFTAFITDHPRSRLRGAQA